MIFFWLRSFFVQKTKSTRDTLGVGTLIATPSNFPGSEGIISTIALDAPVDVGTIDWLADLALLGSLWELSKILWSLVKEWMVVIKPVSMSKFSFRTCATGAIQLVVNDAAERILSSFFNSNSLPPKTIVFSAFSHGAETRMFCEPLIRLVLNLS